LAVAGCSDPLSEEGGFDGPGRTASARVTRHTDGDTLWLSGIGKVRLIGVDTPEVFGEDECFGRRASAFVERTAPLGTRVRYRLGVEERDRYGRALAYVWLQGGGFLNRQLLARGYAQPLTIPPNVEYADLFARVARNAREAGRGLWGRPGCAAPRR
jgi:micrococcal nuclease